ncbi:MAG: LacI family transcriptional regulator [Gaiellaceae bacterium]|nr:LacI family transcriptional regulator [Gaiellaceae bacterium]
MAVTVSEVAKHAGVSPMTVSRVVNGSPRVSPATRKRVEEAVAELGYVPNRLARGLTQRRTGVIGLIVPDIANPFYTLLVSGVEKVAARAGCHVLLCNTHGDLERERDYLEDMVAFRADGVLIAPVSDRSKSNLRTLAQHKLPVVLIDRTVQGFESDLVQGDSVTGARRLVDHLIELGHRDIAMITEDPSVSTARDRYQGYDDALGAAGIPVNPEYVVPSNAIDPEHVRNATRRLLQRPDRPSAIFAVNNLAALGVAEAARDEGLTIPDDLALVCFDDIDYASRLYPFLTVMAQPAETFGTIAGQLLLDRLEHPQGNRTRTVVLPAEFIVRVSCGATRRPAGAAP